MSSTQTPPNEQSTAPTESPRQNQSQHQQQYQNKPGDPLPEDRFSIDYAVALWEQIENCNYKDPNQASWLVDHLRNAAELALWGDKNNHEVADFLIMESTMVSHITEIIITPNLDNGIYVQCIQSVVILLQNHKRESTLFFILSNGKFNRIIEAKLDYENEEVVTNFVSFLKTVTQRLQSKNILPLFCNGGSFPLLAAAMNSSLLTHDDRMVRTSVRQVIAQLFRIQDSAVKEFATGCIPRLIDDLGAFLEAQLRNLALYVTDESASITFVEMTDEDILDEGLYFVDLLAGCITEEEKSQMGRLMREFVLERLLAHAQDADSSDLVVSTIVLLFLSKWFRSAPKWFLNCCLKSVTVRGGSFSSINNNNKEQENSSNGEEEPNRGREVDSAVISALSWALLVPRSATAHHPASTVTRSAICCLGSLFHILTEEKVEGCCYIAANDNNNSNNKDDNDADENQQSQEIILRLGQLVHDSLEGFAKKIDRTSVYNFAAISHIETVINKNNSSNKVGQPPLLHDFFNLICKDSDLFAPEQSALRLEILMMLMKNEDNKNVKENPFFFPESNLHIFARDQWQGFIEDLRFPLKRMLKFRSPVSQQERSTHRASVICLFLTMAENTVFESAQLQEVKKELNALSKKTLFVAPSQTTTSKDTSSSVLSGSVVSEEISPEGGLPSVFLSIEGNTLKITRYKFSQLLNNNLIDVIGKEAVIAASVTNENNYKNNSSSSSKRDAMSSANINKIVVEKEDPEIQHLPLVALQLTQDVSRPFVLHFCTPQCVNATPFSMSFSSRKIASRALSVLDNASKVLREQSRKKFQEALQ